MFLHHDESDDGKWPVTIPVGGQTSGSAFGPRMFRSLKNPTFRLYLIGSLAQFASLSMQIITGPLLMYRITGSRALLGTMALISAFPMIIVSLFGGVIADRIPKKRIIILGLIGSAIVSLGIAVALSTGVISRENTNSWMILVAGMLCMGSLMGIMMPAMQSLVAELVIREELMNAVAFNTMGMNILTIASPSVAGPIIDNSGFDTVYYVMTGLYIVSTLFIFSIPVGTRPPEKSGNVLLEIQQGFQYMRRDYMIMVVLLFSLVATALSMPYQQLLPIYTDDILHVSATSQGVMMSTAGIGALVGSGILAALPNRKRGLLLMSSGVIAGSALVVFSFSATWGLSLATMVFIGLGQTFRMTIGSTLLQAYAEAEYRGRVMSIFSMQWGLMSVITFFAGLISEEAPIQWVLGSISMLLILLSILAIIFIPRFRKLD
jgi:MFS family permease